jgi:NADH-quinone oxidoreductase subunit K
MVSLANYLLFALVLFVIGLAGVLFRKNLIIVLMSFELMLNAINISLVSFSYFNNLIDAQVIVVFIMVLAACEVSVALAILVAIFKHYQSIDLRDLIKLKG